MSQVSLAAPGFGLRGIRTIREFELSDKVVFLRLDLNVPMEDGVITDRTRILASLPTISYALEKKAKLVLASHLGRPKNADDKKYSLEPVGKLLSELLKVDVMLVEDPSSDAVKALLAGLKRNQILLLENVRFEEGETKNSKEFAQVLASYTDIYINDAFGASHRAHASIEALPSLLKHKGIGFLIEKEVQFLDKLIHQPDRPYWAILGGSKVSDKIQVIEKLLDLVDGLVIGGAMAYTFLKAKGISIGSSRLEADKVSYAKEIIARVEARRKKLILPVDHMVAMGIKDTSGKLTASAEIEDAWMGVDIGPKTIELIRKNLESAKTIFWNGPVGVFENPAFSVGSFGIAQVMAENKKAIRVVGGGDSAAAAEASGFADQMTHISTGGGASLEYLQGDPLPGLEVLRLRKGSSLVEPSL